VWNGSVYPADWFNLPIIVGLTFSTDTPIAGSVAWTSSRSVTRESFIPSPQGIPPTNSYGGRKGQVTRSYDRGRRAVDCRRSVHHCPECRGQSIQFTLPKTSCTPIYIAAGSITADKISVANLAAIIADLGTVTAGTLTAVTVQTSAANPRVIMDVNGVRQLDAGGNVIAQLYADGTPPIILTADKSCEVTNSTNQNISDTTWGPTGGLVFNTDTDDVGNWHDTVTNNQRITVPDDGRYIAIGQMIQRGHHTGATRREDSVERQRGQPHGRRRSRPVHR